MRQEFNKSLKSIAKPILEKYGYFFDGKRKFIKKNNNTFIIEYQVGIRSTQGTFTVNLIFGDKQERLSCVNPTLFSKIVNALFKQYDPWWKGVFLPKDQWWEISPFQKEMDSTIKQTTNKLESYGIDWLENKMKRT